MASRTVINAGKDKTDVLADIIINNEKRTTTAIRSLENKILKLVNQLETQGGLLVNDAQNLALATQMRIDLVSLFNQEFIDKFAKESLDEVDRGLVASKKYLEAVKLPTFVEADLDIIDSLKSGVFAKFDVLSQQFQSGLADSIYLAVLGGDDFENVIETVRNSLTGIEDLAGRPMATHAETIANTAILDVDRGVTLKKADDAGVEHLLYSGTIKDTSRDHCMTYAGQIKTKEEWQDIWMLDWQGKSGSNLADGGGWNCMHVFLPVPSEAL